MTFAEWLATQPGLDKDKAVRLKLSPENLSRYKNGRTPKAVELYRLMALTGLPAEAFIPKPVSRRRARKVA